MGQIRNVENKERFGLAKEKVVVGVGRHGFDRGGRGGVQDAEEREEIGGSDGKAGEER